MSNNVDGRIAQRRQVAFGLIFFGAQRRMKAAEHEVEFAQGIVVHIAFAAGI